MSAILEYLNFLNQESLFFRGTLYIYMVYKYGTQNWAPSPKLSGGARMRGVVGLKLLVLKYYNFLLWYKGRVKKKSKKSGPGVHLSWSPLTEMWTA